MRSQDIRVGPRGVGTEQGGAGRLDSTNGAGGGFARGTVTGDEGMLVAQGGNA